SCGSARTTPTRCAATASTRVGGRPPPVRNSASRPSSPAEPAQPAEHPRVCGSQGRVLSTQHVPHAEVRSGGHGAV
ncbi:MAG: hypothetical protein L0H64_10215, partial [Pseudonocardia sp.]|nr:hypothetical protein [Pseudonocardia sp.]